MSFEQMTLFEDTPTSEVASLFPVQSVVAVQLASRVAGSAPVPKTKPAPRSSGKKAGKPGPGGKTASMKWSHSAHKTFRRCQSQFLFSHVLAHHSARDAVRHEAYRLKQAKDFNLWRGNLVDDAIELWVAPRLQSGQLMPLDELLKRSFEMMEQQLAFSKARRHLELGLSKGEAGKSFLVLGVHERGEEAPPQELDWVRAEVELALTNLYSLTSFLEELRGHAFYEPRQRFSFRFDEFTIGGEFDLLIWKNNGRPLVIDWKVVESPTSDHTDQMLLYALAISRLNPRVRPEDIEVKEVRLREPEIRNYAITPEKLADVENFVFHSGHQMKALLRGLGAQDQRIEDFEVADKPGSCAMCSFRPLCQRLHSQAALEEDLDL